MSTHRFVIAGEMPTTGSIKDQHTLYESIKTEYEALEAAVLKHGGTLSCVPARVGRRAATAPVAVATDPSPPVASAVHDAASTVSGTQHGRRVG